MMEDFYIYIIQVNVALLVFYFLFKLLFSRDTFLEIRRLFLLTIVVLAFSYPVITFSSGLKIQQPLQVAMVNYVEILTEAAAVVAPAETTPVYTWQDFVWVLWGIGSMFLLFRVLVQLFIVCRMVRQGKRECWDGQRVIVLSGDMTPFSFLGWIFINPVYHEDKELAEIMAHEKTHVHQWHSLDMLVGELLCITFWFNPVVWFLRKEIRQNLEFLADQHVVSSGYNRKNYQYHLLRLSHQSTAVPIVNNFNVSSLKKRIIMMNKKKTSRIGLMKYALLIPVTGILVLSANAKTVVEIAGSEMKEWRGLEPPGLQIKQDAPIVLKGKVTDENSLPLAGATVLIQKTSSGNMTDENGEFTISADKAGTLCFSYVGKKTEYLSFQKSMEGIQVVLKKDVMQLEGVVVAGMVSDSAKTVEPVAFQVVEEMPRFLGGNIAQYLAKVIKYPVRAMEKGIEGQVFVSFVVSKTGEVTQVKVIKSVSEELDKEAIRVVSQMPAWSPGKQRGKTVDVEYTLPIEFMICKPEKKNDPVTHGFVDSVAERRNEVTLYGYRHGKDAPQQFTKEEFQNLLKGKSNENALIILNGKKVTSDDVIKSIDMNKLKSVSVLKEESAKLLYGEAGKNGVIVIDTEDVVRQNSPGNKEGDGTLTAAMLRELLEGKLSPDQEKPCLVIVDGKKYDGKKITPDEVKSLELLKDKVAVAIHGKEGENGVIILTTKKAKK